MKDNKKLTSILIAGVLIVVGVAAAIVIRGLRKNSNPLAAEGSKGNCQILECMEKFNGEMSVGEINNIIGFEGEVKSDTDLYTTYNWQLSEKTSIEAMISKKYNTASIEANYPSDLWPKGADFSKWDEIQSILKSSEKLTYDKFVELVGGVQGVLSKVDSSRKTYHWYNADGGYLFGLFDENNVCTLASGRF